MLGGFDRMALCSAYVARRLLSMTFQVGLVGIDGLVLASDRLINHRSGDCFSASVSSKLYTTASVACCWSGGDAGQHAFSKVGDEKWDVVPATDRAKRLRGIALEAWREIHPRSTSPEDLDMARPSRVLVGFLDDPANLWDVQVYGFRTTVGMVRDMVISGDTGNSAHHIIKRYFRKKRRVNELLTLAAYAILMAHKESSATVGELQFTVIRSNGVVTQSTNNQEQALLERAELIHDEFISKLYQPFDL